jgi:AcrR family transcriptional regulator
MLGWFPPGGTSTTRREELLSISAGLFAERGLRVITVRDIAGAAGIL